MTTTTDTTTPSWAARARVQDAGVAAPVGGTRIGMRIGTVDIAPVDGSGHGTGLPSAGSSPATTYLAPLFTRDDATGLPSRAAPV